MKLEIVFRGTDPSDAMEKYVIKYVKKFKKYVAKQDPESTFVHVVLEGKLNHHIYMVEVRLKSQLFDIVAKRDGADMYSLIDETMHVMERELQKQKQRVVDDIKKRTKGFAFIFIAAINLSGLLYSKPIKILNWNVLGKTVGFDHGKSEYNNPARFLDKENYYASNALIPTIPSIIRAINPDIIFMQEIASDDLFKQSMEYQLVSWQNKGASGTGVGVFIKNGILSFSPVKREKIRFPNPGQKDTYGAVAGVFLLIDDAVIFVVSIHIPNKLYYDDTNVKRAFYFLAEKIIGKMRCPIIIAGDFNTDPQAVHENIHLLGKGFDIYDGLTMRRENKMLTCTDYVISRGLDKVSDATCIGSDMRKHSKKPLVMCKHDVERNARLDKRDLFGKIEIFPSDHDPVVCTFTPSGHHKVSLESIQGVYGIELLVQS